MAPYSLASFCVLSSKAAYVDPFAVVIGDCQIGKLVLVAPFAVCRGDEGTPIYIGNYSNLQDGVILHSLETTAHDKNIDDRRFSAEGLLLKANDTAFKNGFAIYVGNKVSLAHDVQVHGSAYIGNDTFVGMKTLVFNAKLGERDAIGVSSTITNGVIIPGDKFVPPGSIITTQRKQTNYRPEWGTFFVNSVSEDTINDDSFRICPMCNKENSISLMSLRKNEAYRISLEDKRGLEIQFLKLKTLGDNL